MDEIIPFQRSIYTYSQSVNPASMPYEPPVGRICLPPWVVSQRSVGGSESRLAAMDATQGCDRPVPARRSRCARSVNYTQLVTVRSANASVSYLLDLASRGNWVTRKVKRGCHDARIKQHNSVILAFFRTSDSFFYESHQSAILLFNFGAPGPCSGGPGGS